MSNASSEHSFYRSRDAVVTREILGETLLVPISADLADLDAIFALNETGAFIWRRLDGEHSLGQLRDAIVDSFEVDPEDAWRDMSELLGALRERRLVERVC